jgi:hypothetical protein
VEEIMKRKVVIAICVAGIAGIAAIALLAHRHVQVSKQKEIEKVAEALKQYSTGDGWGFPPPLETIVQSNIVIQREVRISEPTLFELQEEERKRIQRMALIDDRPTEKATEPPTGGDGKPAPQP